jgi:hypothetical protein
VEKNEVKNEEPQQQRFEKTPAVSPRVGEGAQHSDNCENPNVSAGTSASVIASQKITR